MDQSLQNTHVKLLVHDLLRLKRSSDPITFSHRGVSVSRAETVGTVTSRDFKPKQFLKFTLDDGTGCLTCILWLNHFSSPHFSRRDPTTVQLLARVADDLSRQIKIGRVVRVRGRITTYRNAIQITVSDAVIERDPNAESFHWLECIRLARRCYDRRLPRK